MHGTPCNTRVCSNDLVHSSSVRYGNGPDENLECVILNGNDLKSNENIFSVNLLTFIILPNKFMHIDFILSLIWSVW